MQGVRTEFLEIKNALLFVDRHVAAIIPHFPQVFNFYLIIFLVNNPVYLAHHLRYKMRDDCIATENFYFSILELVFHWLHSVLITVASLAVLGKKLKKKGEIM